MDKITEELFQEVYNESNNKQRLIELTTEQFYHLLADNLLRRCVSPEKHARMIVKVFGNIKNYEYDIHHNRIETSNTHLQDANGNYCNKQKFREDFLEYDFNNPNEAEKCLSTLLEKFDDDGWLIIES